ncbi:MAG: sugar phosphate nucleotidyltransferase [Thermoplasmatales archaeon]
MERIRKAVISAAGMGRRFYPLTRAQPKELLPILDKPVIHYVVEIAVESGMDEVFIIVGSAFHRRRGPCRFAWGHDIHV